jgi:transcriptional regulator with PAS, ATPase and Fis domain
VEDPTDTQPSPQIDVPNVLVAWEGTSRVIALGKGAGFVVGRSQSCDLCIDHASISRRHLALYGGDVPAIEDLGSSNGTMAGGVRLTPEVRRPLRVGEIVQFGVATLVLVQGAVVPGPETPPQALDDLVRLVAASELSVILQGETGVGKEVYAESIHAQSSRATGPLIKINCAALPDALIESELFGHDRGAFTGAEHAKPGLVEMADGGTLFLDEIGEMSPLAQAKVLRFLETKECQRVGSTKPRRIDIRIVAATHQDLAHRVAEGSFRADLYYRLNGIRITIQPLRMRREEIPRLAAAFATAPDGTPIEIRPAALARLDAHAWPGNVRELRTVVRRAAVLSQAQPIEPHHVTFDEVPAMGQRPDGPPSAVPTSMPPDVGTDYEAAARDLEVRRLELERQRIVDALDRSGGNQTKAADLLGVSRRWLIKRIEAMALPRPRKR